MERPQLVIQINEKGGVTVLGPLHDRTICYALLEAARDIIHDQKPQAAPLVVPVGVIPRIVPNRG